MGIDWDDVSAYVVAVVIGVRVERWIHNEDVDKVDALSLVSNGVVNTDVVGNCNWVVVNELELLRIPAET